MTRPLHRFAFIALLLALFAANPTLAQSSEDAEDGDDVRDAPLRLGCSGGFRLSGYV
jgi:hypothetical protein